MGSIDINVNGRKYVLSGEGETEHLEEVAELVRRKIETLRKERPHLTPQSAAILAAFDFASLAISSKKKGQQYRSTILDKAHELLRKVEGELSYQKSLT